MSSRTDAPGSRSVGRSVGRLLERSIVEHVTATPCKRQASQATSLARAGSMSAAPHKSRGTQTPHPAGGDRRTPKNAGQPVLGRGGSLVRLSRVRVVTVRRRKRVGGLIA